MEQAPAVLSALENCILGSALDAVAPQDMWELPDPADAPHLAAALAAVAAESTRAEQAFQLGLRALLDGIAARLVDPTVAVPASANAAVGSVSRSR
jgi:hypothetical protein